MTASLIQFLMSAGVIVAAGAALTQFADGISQKTKLGRLLIGSILLAGGTSLPELSINFNVVRIGSPDMAAGDLIGSSLWNILILAAMDMTRYSKGQMLSHASAAQALPAGMSITLTALVAISIYMSSQFEPATLAGMGLGSIVIGAAYVIGSRLIYSGQKESSSSSSEEKSVSWIPGLKKLGLKGTVTGFVIAAGVIVLAAPFLARAAKDLAERSGLGGTFFGTAFVALCTSLPELVTTFTAVRMKAFNLVLGNIFGSNCFNMVLFLPLDFVAREPLFAAVSQTHIFTALCAILVTMVVILGQLYQVERKKHFLEPDALIVIALVLGALTGLYFLR